MEDSSSERQRLTLVFLIQALASVAGNLLTVGIFFFTQQTFGWQLRENLLLSAVVGAFYTIGAMSAHALSSRLGSARTMFVLYTLILLAAIVPVFHVTPVTVVLASLVYVTCSSACWPILESLVTCGDLDAHEMSRRVGIYNLVWAGVAAVVVAVNGLILKNWPVGVFIISATCCGIAAAICMLAKIEPVASSDTSNSAHPEPEPQLIRQRQLALWLSRLSMPSMYVVIFALAAMLPSLAVIQQYDITTQTLLASVWLFFRWLTFLWLGATVFWHTRPRLLLAASAALLISFLAITLRPSLLIGVSNQPLDLASMIAAQVLFGIGSGMIYMASLYFGMVLSEGSTEHGGYHEALIGVGMTVGPAAAFLTQTLYPGSYGASVAAVAVVTGAGALMSAIASIKFGKKQTT